MPPHVQPWYMKDEPPMDDLFNSHDLMHLGAYLIGLIVTIAVVKTDIRWIKEWMLHHDRSDDARFNDVHKDIREVRDQILRGSGGK